MELSGDADGHGAGEVAEGPSVASLGLIVSDRGAGGGGVVPAIVLRWEYASMVAIPWNAVLFVVSLRVILLI